MMRFPHGGGSSGTAQAGGLNAPEPIRGVNLGNWLVLEK